MQSLDGPCWLPLDLAANCTTTTPASVKFQSRPVARPGNLWPAAMGSRRQSVAQLERLQPVLNCRSIKQRQGLFMAGCRHPKWRIYRQQVPRTRSSCLGPMAGQRPWHSKQRRWFQASGDFTAVL